MSFMDDELTDADLKFLNQWEKLGKSETADAEYQLETNLYEEVGDDEEADIEGPGEGEGDFEGELDESVEGDEPSGEEGEIIDESRMDLSDLESQSDDRRSDLDGDPEAGEDEDLGDISDAEDDELDFDDLKNDTELSDEAEDRDQLTGGDTDSDIPEGEDDLEYDPDLDSSEEELGDADNSDIDSSDLDGDIDSDDLESDSSDDLESDKENAQVEEEFGDGERGNTESEIEDLDEYERERDKHQGEPDSSDGEGIDEGTEESDEPETETEENDETESSSENEVDDDRNSEPEADRDSGRDTDERDPGSGSGEDSDEAGESEEQPEIEIEQEIPEGFFDELPEADDRCNNHCEDNPEEETDYEECEHCRARLEKEREIWGVVAQDKHGHDLMPGDRVRVVIPMPFTTLHSVLTVNVPNLEVDPPRVSESTAGEINSEVCWLSGRAISKFTGWHLTKDGSIWTFKKGKKIRFAEKIDSPDFQRHGSNDLDGDQLDTEDMIEQFQNELDELPEHDPESELENDDNEENDDDVDDSGTGEGSEGDGGELDETEKDDQEDAEEDPHQRNSSQLTATQKKRFENLVTRITRKVEETFGNTLEAIQIQEIKDLGSVVECDVWILSRGIEFMIKFAIQRSAIEEDEDE